ncbi:cell wall metabolism sensor histidine kinase WalK [Arthrobacter sp. ISL-30]|uniref:sensor histidine kinase n=1 Tax=Arthrobacter sp. ISL-30 TaxID=2819109 RepID=UPI001BE87DC6|nr:sensor histidine kinase [Arthrobacter sp. ISL-30]MBT2515265.1 PAS domain-containing sensor histidine kinase [Arthrobacter sp. ISL-30]
MKPPIAWNIASGRLLFFKRAFHEYTLRDRVVLSQFPLTVTSCIAAIIVVLFFRESLENPFFVLFLLLQGLALLLCYLVPWEKLPFPSFLSIPVLDLISIGLGREGDQEGLTGISLLAVFPVIWFCASGLYPRAAIAMSFLGPLAIIWIPLFLRGTVTPQELTRSFLLPVMMLGIGISVSVLTLSMVRQQRDLEEQQRALEEKDAALQQALENSQHQERLLNTVLETVHLGVLAVDANGNDVMMNRKQRKNHELASGGNNELNEGELLVFSADRTTPVPAEKRPVQRAVLGQEFTDYLVWIGSGSEQRAITTSARAMRDADGNFAGSVIVFSDVTDLVTALAAKDDFVSNVSHEFRTPLTSILGYLEMMLSEPDELQPSIASQMVIVRRNAERLLSLVSDLLSVRTGSMTVQPQAVDVAELVRSSVDSAKPRAHESGVQFRVNVPQRLEAHVDAARISQVLDNLISNAIKYSPEGGHVEVSLESENGAIVCRVKDTGIGMDEKDQAEVFTKYFRSGEARNLKIPGVGLGLPISKAIVEAHGGEIDLISVPGQGTTFTFRVPA